MENYYVMTVMNYRPLEKPPVVCFSLIQAKSRPIIHHKALNYVHKYSPT